MFRKGTLEFMNQLGLGAGFCKIILVFMQEASVVKPWCALLGGGSCVVGRKKGKGTTSSILQKEKKSEKCR